MTAPPATGSAESPLAAIFALTSSDDVPETKTSYLSPAGVDVAGSARAADAPPPPATTSAGKSAP